MLNFDELKDKVLATAGTVAEKTAEFAKAAADKTVVLGKLTKLNTELAKERDTLRRTYAEIGRMYYEKHKDDAEEELQQAVADAEQSLKLLDAKKKQVDALKAELSESGVDYSDYENYEAEGDVTVTVETEEAVPEADVQPAEAKEDVGE